MYQECTPFPDISMDLLKSQCAAALGNRQDLLLDAVQETLIKIWLAHQSRETVRHPRAWAARISCNASRNLLRGESKHQRNRQLPKEEEDIYESWGHWANQDEVFSIQEALRRLSHKLSERQKAILRLICQGHTQQKIADCLKISKTRVNQELTIIRKLLQRRCI